MECVSKREVQSSSEFFRGILTKLDEYRKQSRLYDIKVVVEGREFPAHRGVLAANSGFFEGLFSTGLKETTEDSVRITELNSNVFEKLLSYMYTGEFVEIVILPLALHWHVSPGVKVAKEAGTGREILKCEA